VASLRDLVTLGRGDDLTSDIRASFAAALQAAFFLLLTSEYDTLFTVTAITILKWLIKDITINVI